MAVDFVFPNGDEQSYIKIAERLGYTSLVLCYKQPVKIDSLQKKTDIKLYIAILANGNSAMKLRNKADLLIASDADARHLIEKTPVKLVFELESSNRKDFIHQRNSGLNHIIARIASEKSKIIGFSFRSLLDARGMLRAQLIGRMTQNIKICRKYKVKMALASFADNPYKMRSPHDLKALGVTLGMHPKEAKQALDSL